jgi:crotonobetainyl-CoA:carnitine CoA-transferase CaiB-like acyl-CoA transferase
MWQRLCTMLDMPDMANDPAYSTSAKRRANRAKLEQILNQRLAQRPKQEWIEKFRAAGLPAGPVYNMAEVFADPQVQNNRMVETIDHPKIGPLRQLASAMGLECFDQGSVRMPPPLLGQHTDEILRQFGVPRAQVEALVAAGTIRAA